MKTIVEQFDRARMGGVPLLGIRTPDPGATIRALERARNGTPMLLWDCIRGVKAINDAGLPLIDRMLGGKPEETLWNPVTTLRRAYVKDVLPPRTILFFANPQRFLHEPAVIQAIWNLREVFKADERTLVLLAPSLKLPPELAQDVLMLDEPYPTPTELAAIVIATYDSLRGEVPTLPKPDAKMIERCVDAMTGLSAFAAETAAAMSMTNCGTANAKP